MKDIKGVDYMYTDFASLYDELMDDVDYKSWYLYIESIFKKFKKNPKKLLEMACGTGNLSYYLAKNGYDLTCFDLSLEMLSIADSKLNEFKNIRFLNQNMIDFNIGEEYDAVISICDSINYILDETNLLKTFKNVKKHLNKDGIFIFDINSYHKLSHIIGFNTFVEEKEHLYYIWQNYFDKNANIAEFYLTFFVQGKDNKYIKFNEEHLQRAYKIDEIIKMLELASFTEIKFFDGITFEKANDKCERITFVAQN